MPMSHVTSHDVIGMIEGWVGWVSGVGVGHGKLTSLIPTNISSKINHVHNL